MAGKPTCLCSPTNHPGSFRCSLHRNLPSHSYSYPYSSSSSDQNNNENKKKVIPVQDSSSASISLKNFLLHMIKIKPSSNDLKRRRNFQPKPSRFSAAAGNNYCSVSADAVSVS